MAVLKEGRVNSITVSCALHRTIYPCNLILSSMALGIAFFRWYILGILEMPALCCIVLTAIAEFRHCTLLIGAKSYFITNAIFFSFLNWYKKITCFNSFISSVKFL